MEPRYSMTAYSVAIGVALVLLSARGFAVAAAGIAVGVLVIALALEASYMVRRQADRVLDHRRNLDRVVRAQWAGIALVGLAVAGLGAMTEASPLSDAGALLATAVVGLAVAAPAVYVSSLVDWYWILPKIAGMVGEAPCERTGGKMYAGVTKIWLFHRAAATTIVTFVLAGVPGFMATTTSDGTEGSAWVILGSALAIGFNSVNDGITQAFRYAFNPRIYVGDVIRVRTDPEKAELHDAYVVDVSIHGLKYKPIAAVPANDPRFLDEGELMHNHEIERIRRSSGAAPPCPGIGSCRAVNWHCFRNPVANDLSASGDVRPCPWGSHDCARSRLSVRLP